MNNSLTQKAERSVVQKILAVFTMAILVSSGSLIFLTATVPAAYAAVTPTVSGTVLGETNIIQVDIDDSNLDEDSDFPVVVITQDDTTDQSLFFTRMTDGTFRAYIASDAADNSSMEDLPLRGTHDPDDGAVENSSPFDYAVDTDADSSNEVLFAVKRGVGTGSKIPASPGNARVESTATGDINGDGDSNDSDILIDPRFVTDIENIIGTADNIDRDTWPIVQLFDLDQDGDFAIEYTTAGTEVSMTADLAAGDDDESVLDIVSVDRTSVPTEGLLRITVSWPERNLDPTAENDELIAAYFRVNGGDVDVDADSDTSDDNGDHDIFHATQDGNNGDFIMAISMEEDNAQEPEKLNDAGSGTSGVLDNNDAVEIILLDWDYTGGITDTGAEFSVGESTANVPNNTPDDGFGPAAGQLDIPGDHGDRTTVVVTETDGSLELIGTGSYNTDLTLRITDEDFNVDADDDDSIDGDADGDSDSTLNIVITFDGATDVTASVDPSETGDNTGVFEATIEWRLGSHAVVAGEDSDELIMSLPSDNPAKSLDIDVIYDDPTTLISTANRAVSDDFGHTEGTLSLDRSTYTLSLLDQVKMTFTLPNANDDVNAIETLRVDISDNADQNATGEYVEVIHLQTGQEVAELRMRTTKVDEDRENADLSAELGGDIILTESGANTGVFTSGYVDLSVLDEIDTAAEFDDATKLRLELYDDAEDDTITVDVDLSESLTTGTLSLDRDKLGITVGATITAAPDIQVTISLTDEDENGDALLREEATIDLTLKSGGGATLYFDDNNDGDVSAGDSTDDIILYETSADSSVFEGTITMRISEVGTDFLYDNTGDQADNTVQILTSADAEIDPEDLVNARLNWDYDDDSVDVDLIFTARTAVITASATTVNIGDEITITLTAPDFNLEPDDEEDLDGGEHESALKFVDSDGDNVAIDLGLEETGDNTGIFTVDITIGDEITSASATDDDLSWPSEVKAGETLTLKFTDDVLASSSSSELVDDTIELDIVVNAHTATLTLDKTEYGPYQEVTVTLVDIDLTLVPDDFSDSNFPELSRIRTNGESLNTDEIGSTGRDINETGEKDGDDTFVWTFTLDTVTGDVVDGAKNVLVDVADVGLDLLEVFYEDGEDAGGDDLVIKDTADIRTRTGAITVTPTVIDIDETFAISLVDPDANADDDIIETVTVEVSSETFPGGQDITLTETGDDTGIFENDVITVVDTIPEGSQIWASVEDTITIEYEDSLDDVGDDLTVTASLRVGVIPTFPVPATGAKIVDTAGATVDASTISTGSLVIIETTVTNDAPVSQDFAYIVQIKNADGVIVMFNFQTGALATAATLNPGISWVPSISGAYTIEVFVFESLATPSPLSEQLSLSATVV